MQLKDKFEKYFKQLCNRLLNKDENQKIIGIITYVTLFIVSVTMTIINIATMKGGLIIYTAVFALLCVINVFLAISSKLGVKIAAIIFAFEFIALFTFFVISGNPDGFSIIWVCMLPSIGLVFYGRHGGTILCVSMLAILIFFLWTPVGNNLLMYEYSTTFKMRFPFLYVAIYLLAFFLETLRVIAFDKINELNAVYKNISIRDRLTNLYNRQGMYEQLEKFSKEKQYKKIGVAIFDIDFFKKVNDTCGHFIGDKVLEDISSLCQTDLNAILCRWGGEEFAFVYYDNDVTESKIDDFRKTIENHNFIYENININLTISIGVYETTECDIKHFDDWAKKADIALYEAKNTGRNKVVKYKGK